MTDRFPDIPSPAFILEEIKLQQNLERIVYVKEQANVSIILALKGFALWKSFPIIRKYIQGATASSLHEVLLCKEYMGTAAHTYAPVYSPEDFEEIAQNSSHISFNSLTQYETYKHMCKKHNVAIGLRINPGYSDIETDMYNPCTPDSRLGIPAEELTHLPEGVSGLHFHALCESNSYSLERVLKSFEKKFAHLLPHISWINMGGGHLVTDAEYDVEHLISVLSKFKQKHKISIILEPGGAFAWQTGVLKARVLDIVHYGKIPTALLDVSFAAHMPDTLEMPYRPHIEGASSEPTEGFIPYRLGGTTCLAGDFLAPYYFPKQLEIGESLILDDMMHYTMVKTTLFNGVRHPSIYIAHTNGYNECVRTFTYDDYKNRLS
jgi:carboxynorspermidine decarboxylase